MGRGRPLIQTLSNGGVFAVCTTGAGGPSLGGIQGQSLAEGLRDAEAFLTRDSLCYRLERFMPAIARGRHS